MSQAFVKFLNDTDVPIVSDGGYSTSLYEKGFYINRSFEELCLTDPSAVKDVVSGFAAAGAQILTTNTFGATLPKLAEFGLQEKLEQIIEAGVRISKEVAAEKPNTFVAGSIGPLGLLIEPLGPTSFDEAVQMFAMNVECFAKAGVDAISIEGLHDLNEMEAAIRAVRENSELPLMCHLGVQENMKTSYGNGLKEYVLLCERYGVEVLGFAGEVGPSGMLTAIHKLAPLTDRPISVLPNAGMPRFVNDQYIYLCSPDYMGKYAKRFVEAGARIVGGHCGVYENHIRAVSNSLKMTANLRPEKKTHHFAQVEITQAERSEPVPMEKRSLWGKDLKEGQRVVSIELNPPKGIAFESFFEKCQQLVDNGVKYVNIPDGARAVARVGAMHLASYVKRKFDLEPIPHYTARDRNLLGLQADLMGGHINGVRNVLIVTGDPPKLGNCPGASGVYDVDAIGLTHITNYLNQGLDLGGTSFGDPTEYVVGIALNPTAANQELEVDRLRYKIEAGAEYAITQPIYDLDAYQRFFDKVGDVSIPIVMGIWPLVSLRNAEFLKNEVPGVEVPDWVLQEMEKAGGDKEESVKRGLDIAVNIMEKSLSFTQGFQVSAPFNRVKVAMDAVRSVDPAFKN